ncbi:MAG: ribosome small subunit-dependent GTPase A [Spirochaetes bacterium]|nr:ribosome small subunit-dependent GTPase A [Spirochaetota bacterium]
MGLLEKYGWNTFFEEQYIKLNSELQPARIIAQYSNLYRLITREGEMIGENSGKIEFNAQLQKDLPVVGDWVLVDIFKDDSKAIVHEVLPRKTVISRQKVGKRIEEQTIAANTEIVFIVSALDNDFNLRRIERYLTIVHRTEMMPVLIFNKTDLKKSYKKMRSEVDRIAGKTKQIYISVKKKSGFEELTPLLKKGKTICFIGSSGVGKSSIINFLMGTEVIKTAEVREKDHKGRHVTSSRQMYLLPSGAIVIDTPGMRELGVWAEEDDLKDTFEDIKKIEERCKFHNCSHTGEPGCAIQNAIANNDLSESRYNSYLKLKKELAYIRMKEEGTGNTKKRWKDRSKEIKKWRKEHRKR